MSKKPIRASKSNDTLQPDYHVFDHRTMIGTTLEDIRDHIEALASEKGEYSLVCGRYGDRPVPAAGLRFENRTAAQAAARATEQYRAALRQYDPRLPYYDVIAQQETGVSDPLEGRYSRTLIENERRSSDEKDDKNEEWLLSDPVLAGESSDFVATDEPPESGETPERRRLIEFCHHVAAAVFETLSEGGYEQVESAVMDAYFELAETVSDPDDLCLCLLESMATTLDAKLEPAEQAVILSRAADRLDALPAAEEPVGATFGRLQRHGLVGSYDLLSSSIDSARKRSVVIHMPRYALSPRSGRLPVFPIIIDLVRHGLEGVPSAVWAVPVEDGWRLTFVFTNGTESDGTAPSGLASAPIGSSA